MVFGLSIIAVIKQTLATFQLDVSPHVRDTLWFILESTIILQHSILQVKTQYTLFPSYKVLTKKRSLGFVRQKGYDA